MNQSQLTYLIELLDDDSTEIRNEILKQLNVYGFELEEDLKNYSELIDNERMNLIIPVLEKNRREWISKNWDTWFENENVNDKIEGALSIISKFHYGLNYRPDIPKLLDEISEEFKNKLPYGDELDLSFFLFQEKKFTGAREDYKNPFNSNLLYTLKEKRGLPITLSLLYVLIGGRLGFNVKGCNYPGHFLAKVEMDEELIFIDCFNGGKIFYENDLRNLLDDKSENIIEHVKVDVSAETIIIRVLNNLVNSYIFLNDSVNTDFFKSLISLTTNKK